MTLLSLTYARPLATGAGPGLQPRSRARSEPKVTDSDLQGPPAEAAPFFSGSSSSTATHRAR